MSTCLVKKDDQGSLQDASVSEGTRLFKPFTTNGIRPELQNVVCDGVTCVLQDRYFFCQINWTTKGLNKLVSWKEKRWISKGYRDHGIPGMKPFTTKSHKVSKKHRYTETPEIRYLFQTK